MNSSKSCAGCRKPITKRDFLKCMSCEETYDIDCVNISYSFFVLMKQKDKWLCPVCKNNKPKTGNINTPVRPSTAVEDAIPSADEGDRNITKRKKNSRPSGNTTSSGQLMNYEDISPQATPEQNDTITDLKLYLTDLIKSQVDSLRGTITELVDTIKTHNTRIEQLERKVEELEKRSDNEDDTNFLQCRIANLETEINDRDQLLLLNDVEISGCPEEVKENSTSIVIALAKKIGVSLDEKDIVCAERAGPPRAAAHGGATGNPRPLVVRLARRATRDSLLREARVRRSATTEGLPVSGPARPFYVNERLTKHNRHLFQRARELARSKNFKFVWTRDGKIFARQEDGKARHRLRTEEDLERVFGSHDI